jgi:hypothetical protein
MREVGERDAPFDFAPLRSGRTGINGMKKAGEENPFVLSVAASAAESKRERDRQQR